MLPKRLRPYVPKVRDAVILGCFTVLASIAGASVPLLVEATPAHELPAPAAGGPNASEGTAVALAPLLLRVWNKDGHLWRGSPVHCHLGGEAGAGLLDPTVASDGAGRCLWEAVPGGRYRVDVTKRRDPDSLGDEYWGHLEVAAPASVSFLRRAPGMADLAVPQPLTGDGLRALLTVRNPDVEARDVYVRCIWDDDRALPYAALATTEVRRLAAGALEAFTCEAPTPPLRAGTVLTLGFEVHTLYPADLLTDSWWSLHRIRV